MAKNYLSQVKEILRTRGHDVRQFSFHCIDKLKIDAEAFIKRERFDQAEECYSACLEILTLVKDAEQICVLSPSDVAVLWCNRSFVRCRQGKLADAFSDAEESIKMDPHYTKGYWRASQAKKFMSQYDEAARHLCLALTEKPGSDQGYIVMISELAIIVSLMKSPREWRKCHYILFLTTSAPHIWEGIIMYLCDKNEYNALAVLTTGTCGNSEVPPTQLHQMAAKSGMSFSCVNVGKMLKFLTDKEGAQAWHLKLADFLVKHGANIETLVTNFSQPLLVVVTALCVEAEKSSFLSWAWNALSPAEYDQVDGFGNTPAHVLAKHPKHLKRSSEIICQDLLSRGCLASEKDKNGNPPCFYCRQDCSVRILLESTMEPDGEQYVSDRVDQIKEAGNRAFKNKELDKAIGLYQKACDICKKCTTLKPKAAILLNNIAAVYQDKQDYPQALRAAEKSLLEDPSNFKGYFRKGQALCKLEKHQEACRAFTAGLSYSWGEDRFKFLFQSVSSLPQVKECDRYDLMRKMKPFLQENGAKLLEKLTVDKMWTAVKILILGPPIEDSARRNASGKRKGFMAEVDAGKAKLATIFEVLHGLQTDAPALVEALLLQGAAPEKLATSDKDNHFHAAVRFCVQTDDARILEKILQGMQRNTMHSFTNPEGRTPLHTLCLECHKKKAESSTFVRIAQILFDSGVNSEAKDKYQRQAMDYAPEGSQLKQYIEQRIQEKKTPFTKRPSVSANTGRKTWKQLKDEGNQVYKDANNYQSAIHLYTQAIQSLEKDSQARQLSPGVLNDEDGHNLAILYGNRAECWSKLGIADKFLEDAKRNVDYRPNWFKGHFRVAKAFQAQEKWQKAAGAFLNAYHRLERTDPSVLREQILYDLIDTIHASGEDPSSAIANIRDLPSETWADLSYKFIVNDRWDIAEFVYKQMRDGPRIPHDIKLDIFCKADKLGSNKWITGLVLWFLISGADHTTLKFDPGDTYFHATITIFVLSGSFPTTIIMNKVVDSEATQLLSYVIEQKVIPNNDRNLKDNKGNTVLHHLASLKGPDKTRVFLTEFLLQKGVDVMAGNKNHKKAVDLASSSDPVKVVLLEYMKRDNAMMKGSKPGAARNDQQKLPEVFGENKRNRRNGEKKEAEKPVRDPQSRECDDCERLLLKAEENRKRQNFAEAYRHLVTIVRMKHFADPRHKTLKRGSIDRIVSLLTSDLTPDIPSTLAQIPAANCREILNTLAQSKKWRQMELLVAKFRQDRGDEMLPNFAKSISLLDLVKDRTFQGGEAAKVDMINFLSNNGATMDLDTSASLLEEAMRNSEWQVALKLLVLKANPKGLTLTAGDTPYHAALQVALTKQPGNFDLLEKLKYLHNGDTKTNSFLNISSQDADGNTLLHLAAQVKFSLHSLTAVEKLCKWQVPADLRNKVGKLPIEYLTSGKDRRAQYLKSAMSHTASSTLTLSRQNEPAESSSGNASSRHQNKLAGYTTVPEMARTRPSQAQASGLLATSGQRTPRDAVLQLLTSMPDVGYNYLSPEKGVDDSTDEKEEESDLSDSDEEDVDRDYADDGEEEESDEETTDNGSECVGQDEENYMDVTVFDNLTWEVECTEEVWNMLRNEKDGHPSKEGKNAGKEKKLRKEQIPDWLTRVIISKIQQLASGDWRAHLQHRVKSVPDSLLLFKIALPQGACVFWELAVAFSPRLSESAESILASYDKEHSTRVSEAVEGGKVYSEIIRVWSIVLKASNRKRVVEKIVSSHRRGEDCIVQRNLKGLKDSQFSETPSRKRRPVLYVESDADPALTKEIQGDFLKRFFPPASAHKNEFHILKFYSFSSSLVHAILEKTDVKIDFPFRVTDLEHAIINLDSKFPLLLLGRSGTGKTTCCLYRIWSKFLSYWEKAKYSGDPLLPRENLLPQPEDECGTDQEEQDSRKEDLAEHPSTVKENRAQNLNFVDPNEANSELEEKQSNTSEDDDDDMDDNGVVYDHIHQLFVTKSPVLCSEMEKNFVRLHHASNLSETDKLPPKAPLANRLQDIDDEAFPLFLTSRQLLLMLDASADGQPFFPRNEEMALKYEIPGWGTQEDIFNLVEYSTLLESSDEEEGDADRKEGTKKQEKQPCSQGARPKHKGGPRQECTYDIFAYAVWPKITNKTKIDCHPSLVWTEIMSFIKGSYEALHSERGYLELKEYLEIGQKRAPNFSGDRHQVFDAFMAYHRYLQYHFLFDEADLVFNINSRLKTMTLGLWALHEIYVDETQDFTQAELALLVSLCQDPNKMFLTGDTAQSIMRGISFRFQDLRSLFYYARESAKKNNLPSVIQIPQKVYQLVYNYRSHSGILSLASSVLDILLDLFPESFDPLEKDQGMFPGPRPVIIESSSPGDLALLLSGTKRKTSHIEFGAHQAILVATEESKTKLPEELTTGIVLTIYESKGLEFDDVLIYNFFKDSPAKKEWRVITEVLEKMAGGDSHSLQDNLVEIDAAVLTQPNRPHRLPFDAKHHKVLNSELKHLYTAITRARVNVWIFDEDDEKRAPMFEYFKARKLITCMGKEDVMETMMFTDTSSKKEWKHAGDNYMQRKFYQLAAKCYGKAGQRDKERLAMAYQTAVDASKMKTSPKAMRVQYFKAAEQFVQCGDLQRAALCFQNAGEYLFSASALEKNGQFEDASNHYIRCGKPEEASRCLEQCGKFGRAIRALVEHKLFDRAIDCLHRYDNEVERLRKDGKLLPAVLIENKPSERHSQANLCYSAADFHYQRGEREKAIAAIQRVEDTAIQINFLKDKGFWVKAAEILAKEGKTEEASQWMLKCGRTEEALQYAKTGFHKSQEAFTHLVLARKLEKDPERNLDEIKYHANKALTKYIEISDIDGQAQAKMMLGKYTKNMNMSKEASRDFDKVRPPNLAGKLESFDVRVKLDQNIKTVESCQDIWRNVTEAFRVLDMLLKLRSEDRERCKQFLHFYGLDLDDSESVTFYPHHHSLCTSFLEISDQEQCKSIVTLGKDKAVEALASFLHKKIDQWSALAREVLDKLKHEYLPCSKHQAGQQCLSSCRSLHRPFRSTKEERDALKILCCCVCLDYQMQKGMETLGDMVENEMSSNVASVSKWQSVVELLQFALPTSVSQFRNQERTQNLISYLRNQKDVKAQIVRYFNYMWDNPGRVGEGKSQSVTKERCKSTDWTVQAAFFAALLKLGKDLDVKNNVESLEADLMANYRDWFFKLEKYALFRPSKSKKDGKWLIETIGSRFLESFQHLTGPKPNLYEAVFTFTKMISALGNRGQLSLMPQLEHLVFWVEFYFLLTWFFIGKANQEWEDGNTWFYLTEFFCSNLHLINSCLEQKDKKSSVTVQNHVVQHTFPQDFYNPAGAMISRQTFLVNFLVGHNEYSKFSLISCVNDLCKKQQPGGFLLAERILLLAAVTLLNIPHKLVSTKSEVPLRREIFKLEVTESMPPKFASFLEQLKSATNYYSIAEAVVTFLEERGYNTLFVCKWTNRDTCPMQIIEGKLKGCSTMVFFDVDIQEEALRSLESATPSQQATPATGDMEMFTEGETDAMDEEDMKRLESKRAEREHQQAETVAIKKIVTVLRACVMRRRLREKTFTNFELEEMFKPYTVSRSWCGVCAIEFSSTDSNVTAGDGDEDDVGDKPSRETHESSAGHKKHMKEFLAFKQLYMSRIHQPLDQIKRFLAKCRVKDHEIYQDIQAEISTLLKSSDDFERSKSDVFNRRSWSSVENLTEAFSELDKSFKKNGPTIEKLYNEHQVKEKAAELKQAKEKEDEDKLLEDMAEIDVNDPTDQPVQGKGHGKGQAGKTKNQRKSHSHRTRKRAAKAAEKKNLEL